MITLRYPLNKNKDKCCPNKNSLRLFVAGYYFLKSKNLFSSLPQGIFCMFCGYYQQSVVGFTSSREHRSRVTFAHTYFTSARTMGSHCAMKYRVRFPDLGWSSTFAVDELNFCVRNGNRWILVAIITGMAPLVGLEGTTG